MKRKPKPYDQIPVDKHGTDTGWQYGCDCDECKKAHSLKAQIANRTKQLDSQWVRKHRMDIHEQNLEEAYRYFGIERAPVGKPPNKDSWMADYNNV